MTQMEKSLNRGELIGFKASDARPNAMIPGIISESPLRFKNANRRAETIYDANGLPLGHWRPTYKRGFNI